MAKRKLVVEKILPDENINILVVGGHPTDAFDNAGGTLTHHIARGDHVSALVLTHGARVHDVVIRELRYRKDKLTPEELEALIQKRCRIRHKEVVDACKIVGFSDVRFLNFEDVVLRVNEELIRAVGKIIREVKPHIIITHYPFENGGLGSHHAVAGQLVLEALGVAATYDPADPYAPWNVSEIYFMGCPPSIWRHNVLAADERAWSDVYVDVTDVIERKIKALCKLKGQGYNEALARVCIAAGERSFGYVNGVPYAEAFIRYACQIHHYLPICNYRYAHSNEREALRVERMIGLPKGRKSRSQADGRGRDGW